jgi:nicotinamidase-related amidase
MSSAQFSSVGRAVTSAQPYAWPYHGRLDATRCALVACVDPAWRVAGPQSDRAGELLGALAAALSDAGGCVVAVTRTPMRGSGWIESGSSAAHAVLGPAANFRVQASGTSAFHGSELDTLLRAGGLSDLLIAGWGLEGPVHSTLRAANDRGYECLLVSDACTSLEPGLAFAACEMVRFSGGIFGAFAGCADVIEVLGAAAGTATDRSI